MQVLMNENAHGKFYPIANKRQWQKALISACSGYRAEKAFVTRWHIPFGQTQWEPVYNQESFAKNKYGRLAAEYRISLWNGENCIANISLPISGKDNE